VVGDRLKHDFSNGRSYYNLHGRPLEFPSEPALRPSEVALAWHREQVFLG
jgi:putative restriction endonuclease